VSQISPRFGSSGESDSVPPNKSRHTVYGSKVDAWALILLGGSLVLAVVLFVHALLAGRILGAILIGALLFVMIGLTVPTRYTITMTDLVVRSGLRVERIPLARIERIHPQKALVASPAWSLDRLGIDYRTADRQRKTVWISPRQRQRFLADIMDRTGLTPRAGQWVRETEP